MEAFENPPMSPSVPPLAVPSPSGNSMLSRRSPFSTSERSQCAKDKADGDDPWKSSSPRARDDIIDEEVNAEVMRGTVLRQMMYGYFGTTCSEYTVGLLVVWNLVFAILETDATANDEEAPEWMAYMNIALMCAYAVEVALRLYVYRIPFFWSPLNTLDLAIVVADVSSFTISCAFGAFGGESIKFLRIIRLLRLTRSYKMLHTFPELVLVLKGLVGAALAAMWGIVLVLFILLIFSVLAVVIVHPIVQDLVLHSDVYDGCPRCGRAFESVAQSTLTLAQHLILGDSWGVVTIPVIEHAPYTAIFFGLTIVVTNLLVLNLILGFIIDAAHCARQGADHENAKCNAKKRRHAMRRFRDMCQQIDSDSSGTISLREFSSGFAEHAGFQDCLVAMGIDKSDIATVFRILDEDGSGFIDYNELAEQLYKMKSADMHTMMSFVRHYVADIKRKLNGTIEGHLESLREEVKLIRNEIVGPADSPTILRGDGAADEPPQRETQAALAQRPWEAPQPQCANLWALKYDLRRVFTEPNRVAVQTSPLDDEVLAALVRVNAEVTRTIQDLTSTSTRLLHCLDKSVPDAVKDEGTLSSSREGHADDSGGSSSNNQVLGGCPSQTSAAQTTATTCCAHRSDPSINLSL